MAKMGLVFRPVVLIVVLLTGLTGVSLGAERSSGAPMSQAEMVKQATTQSAAKHRIELLPDGRARVPSPLQAMEATVAPEGITVRSTSKEEPGTFAIRAAGLCRSGSAMAALPSGRVTVEGQLARITRPSLVEELTTSADGVRQDFVVTAAPPGKGELALELELDGALVDRSGDAARLSLESGRELLYHRLLVTDSRGKQLAARFELVGNTKLRIVVADSGASYPLRIDPTITDADWVSIALPDANHEVTAFQVVGSTLYAGGQFTTIGGILANRIARWDGNSWAPLGSGMNGAVKALAWDGANLYAGGGFTTAGGVSANRIAKWDGSSWSPLGSGMNGPFGGPVHALAWDGANLYAGGWFDTAGGVNVNCIAKWNGSSWSPLGSGINGPVNALAWDGANLYAGGGFTTAGEVSANSIAKWNGNSWSPLGSGVNSTIYALAWDGANLYAGGGFTNAGGMNANYIAKWNGSSWSPLGSGMSYDVFALAWDGVNLYAGGQFSIIGGVSANYIARWDGNTWYPIGSGMNHDVHALAWDGANLYAGGWFSTAGGANANRIAKWDGSNWSPLGSSMDGYASALAWDGANLYAGGNFTTTGGVNANYIAKWNGSSWSPLGSGMNGSVYALVWDGTNLYAGGSFNVAGGVYASYIAKWNGSSWSPLGSGMNDEVSALAWDGANLFAGGSFTAAGGGIANHIAKWNGNSWSPLGSGITGAYVNALVWGGGNLYAGGMFGAAGGVSANYVAKWNGSSWSPLGSGLNDDVSALAWDGANLYAGGHFTFAGVVSTRYIAKWNGSNWSPLGIGMNDDVSALAWDGANLYAGGKFTAADGVSANYIAKWNGSSWSPLGSGMNISSVNALVWGGSNLYAGGGFSIAGGKAARVAYVKIPAKTVTATAGANGTITSTNPLRVVENGKASFTLSPAASYQPSASVSGDCPYGSWNGNSYTTGTITADCTVGFSFFRMYTVTPSAGPNGTITPDTPQSVPEGSSTVFTITPDSGYGIGGVSGCGGSGLTADIYTTDIVNGDCTVTATFLPALYDAGNGTIVDTVNNLTWLKDANCFGGQIWDSANIYAGNLTDGQCGLSAGTRAGDWRLPIIEELQTLINSGRIYGNLAGTFSNLVNGGYYWTTTPHIPGFYFISYVMNGIAYADHKNNPLSTLPVRAGKWYTLRATKSGSGEGTIVASSPYISCSSSCASHIMDSTIVTLTAMANPESIFTGWSGCDTISGNSCTVTMNGSRDVTALFSPLPPPTISGTPATTAMVGTAYSFTPTATDAEGFFYSGTLPPGLSFDSATGAITGTTSSSGIYSDIIITVSNSSGSADLPAFTITVSLNGACGVASGQTFSAAPTTNLCASGIATGVTGTGPWTWVCLGETGGTDSGTCSANLQQYSLSLAAGSGGSLTATASGYGDRSCSGGCSYDYDLNTLVTLTAIPAYGYAFTGWSGACSGSGACQVTMDGAKTVAATFADITPPDTSIASAPPALAASTTFNFAFNATEGGSTFECQLNSGAWNSCSSPYNNSIVYATCTLCRSESPMSFAIRARDTVGNVDQTPATWSWTINFPLTTPIGGVQDGGIVQLPSSAFIGDLKITRPVAFKLKGGYDSFYSVQNGTTTLHGKVTITSGKVTFDHVKIR